MKLHPVATRLCPAGHLPLKGGDYLRLTYHSTFEPRSKQIEILAGDRAQPISPLEGEMSGRTEGGATRSPGNEGPPQ